MPGGARVLLNGLPVLPTGAIQWRLQEGVKPVVSTFHLHPADHAALLDQGNSPITLTIETGERSTVFSRLVLVGPTPGPHDKIQAVTIADRRYWWDRAHVLRRFNMRRNIGFKRVANPEVRELQPVLPEIWYAGYSLRQKDGIPPGAKWTAQQVLDAILKEVTAAEKGGPGGIVIEGEAAAHQMPIENLSIDDAGDAAIQRALGYLPEAAIAVDPDGTVRVFSRVSGRESVLAERALKEEIFQAGHIELTTNRFIRPSAVHVLFSREVEVRLDFDSEVDVQGQQFFAHIGRHLENVLQNTDFEFRSAKGDLVPQGAWITVDEAIEGWRNTPPRAFAAIEEIDIRRAFLPFGDLFGAIALADNFDPHSQWIGRLAALKQHYRQTYRVTRRLMDRIFSLKARTLATIDQATGTLSKSVVFQNYAVIPSQKFHSNLGTIDQTPYVINMGGFPDDGLLTNPQARIAPCEVQILDEDQGIIHLSFVQDIYGNFAEFLPAQVDNSPSGGLSDGQVSSGRKAAMFGAAPSTGQGGTTVAPPASALNESELPQLAPTHKLALLVSVVPAAPNTDGQLHRVVIRPQEVADLLPGAARQGLGSANGPIWEVRIGAGLERARIVWRDDRSDEIELLLGLADDREPNLAGLVTNEGSTSDPTAGASLNAIARAVAARVYASFADHFQGTITTPLMEGAALQGWLAEMQFLAHPDGRVLSALSFPERLPSLDIFRFMDASTRAIILRQVQARE